MKETITLLYNPAAGGGRCARLLNLALKELAKYGTNPQPLKSKHDGIEEQVKELCIQGVSSILIMGGDGTFSQAANGVIKSGKDVSLGLIPGGTGNDFLRSFCIQNINEAVKRIYSSNITRIDVGQLVGTSGFEHYFINIFGIGFISDVVILANSALKKLGKLAYPLSAITCLVKMKAYPLKMQTDSKDLSGEYIIIAVCNSRFTGGSMLFVPNADPVDGKLDMVALKPTSKLEILKLLKKIYKGNHIGHSAVEITGFSKAMIDSNEPLKLLVDGEIIGQTPVTLEVIPQRLKVLL